MSQLPNLPFRECIACDMQNHRFAKILDHADGSVTLDKLSNEVKAKLGGGGGGVGAPGTGVGAEKFNDYDGNIASGDYAHASGCGTHAKGRAQTVVGQFNKVDKDALFIVGNGTSDADRSNAFCVYRDGSITAKFAAYTKEEIDAKIGDIDAALDELHAYAQALVDGGAN